MRPHRAALPGRTVRSRRRMSALSRSLASVFMSPAEQSFSVGLAERGQCTLTARFGIRQQRLEYGIAAQCVEMRAARERRRGAVPLQDGAPQVLEPGTVLPGVA